MEADVLDAWLSQKQPSFGLLIPWEKLYRLTLSMTATKKPTGTDTKIKDHQSVITIRSQKRRNQVRD